MTKVIISLLLEEQEGEESKDTLNFFESVHVRILRSWEGLVIRSNFALSGEVEGNLLAGLQVISRAIQPIEPNSICTENNH